MAAIPAQNLHATLEGFTILQAILINLLLLVLLCHGKLSSEASGLLVCNVLSFASNIKLGE